MKGMEDATFLEEETFIGCSSRENSHKRAYKKGVLELLTLLFPELMIVLYGCSNFWVCGRKPTVWPFDWNLFDSTFT